MQNIWFFFLLAVCVAGGIYWYSMKSTKTMLPHSQTDGWIVVIPGITGDLAKRKLIPALYRLYNKGKRNVIIGTGRRDAAISTILSEAQKFVDDVDVIAWQQFSQQVFYHKLDPTNTHDFKSLAQVIEQHERNQKLLGKRLIYLSLPPEVFCPMTKLFVESGIVQSGQDHFVLYEKPLGWNLASAQEINTCIASLLPERQIYRVDHYVAKGLTQTLPELSFKNSLLASLWNGRFIESVSILFHEKLDIEGRGQFYDRYGAIKDVIQNHVLQLLAFFALDLTRAKTYQEQAKQKADFLNSLTVREVKRGQYEGYKNEKDIVPSSTTETYAAITLDSSDPRWTGVSFFLETGKALAEKKTQLLILFKSDKNSESNVLIIEFAPKESILLPLNGTEDKQLDLQTKTLHYMEAYEALLDDVLSGNLRYRVSFQEIEAQWKLADAMLAASSSMVTYPKGDKAVSFLASGVVRQSKNTDSEKVISL